MRHSFDPEAFRRLRVDAGITQRRLAEVLGVHPGTVNHWSVGRYSPSVTNLSRLAAALGVDLEQLRRTDATPPGQLPAFDAHRLAEARWQAGISQQGVAEALGVTQPLVHMWERGERTPSVEHTRALAGLLGIRVEELAATPESGPTLADLRERRGWSQGLLAAHVELRPSVVARVELGQYFPRSSYRRWADVLGITPEAFTAAWRRSAAPPPS